MWEVLIIFLFRQRISSRTKFKPFFLVRMIVVIMHGATSKIMPFSQSLRLFYRKLLKNLFPEYSRLFRGPLSASIGAGPL
jgi:hypothetical protein